MAESIFGGSPYMGGDSDTDWAKVAETVDTGYQYAIGIVALMVVIVNFIPDPTDPTSDGYKALKWFQQFGGTALAILVVFQAGNGLAKRSDWSGMAQVAVSVVGAVAAVVAPMTIASVNAAK
jgi:hypothetical protein